ncbi:MAG: GGDEF domain-containing protein [Pseudomonadales bacterium]|nr:GGDEF domain-containing protein [Pseudomonadales bacterium]
MTEAQLRAQTRTGLYGAAAALMAILAFLNYRYGLFNLFYTSALFMPLFVFGAVFSIVQFKKQLEETGHEIILTIAVLMIAVRLSQGQPEVQHWLYPLSLLSFLVLSLKSAFLFNGITLVFVSLLVIIVEDIFQGTLFFTSYILLAGLSGMFAYLHHHKTRSLVELSITDPMTGAYNIKHFEETLTTEVCRSETTRYPLSLISLEIDYFPQIKEVHGQAQANEVIKAISRSLNGMIRAGDSLYYDGNERFYFLLPFTPTEGLVVIAERVRRSIEEQTWPVVDSLTVSLGCTTLKTDHETAQLMIRHANEALQEAQRKGHNKVSLSAKS